MEENDKYKLFDGENFQKSSKEELKTFEEIAKHAAQLDVPKGKSKDAAWNEVLNKIDQQEKKSIRQPMVWMAAASVILLVVSYFFLSESDRVVSVGNGELAVIDLPNGSIVTINAGSSISYDGDKWEDERTIKLYGQARFEVTKGSEFTVVTDQGVVKVFGTTFDVFDRKGNYYVSCKSGKVEVTHDQQRQLLTKGRMTRLRGGKLSASTEIGQNGTDGWLKGEYYYESEKLGLVLDEIERQFDVNISRTELLDSRFYSGFFTNKNLKAALQLVLPPMNLGYQVKGKEIQIILND